jgi:acetylornithine/N-succinyldiaminopimelate aminotransferase
VSTSPLMPVYSPPPADFVRGEGARLWTSEGRRYLDFIAGIAVNALGHCHPKMIEAIESQARKVWHLSNMYGTELQRSLAEKYVNATFADMVFFTNSGTEAVECALKTARKYHSANGAPERVDIIGFQGAFHGRTYAAINAAGNATYLDGFGPRLPGYINLPWADHDALEAAIGPETAGIIVEPVQGEGGTRALPLDCLRGLRALCDKHGILLIFDEVQCGAGRTGKLFAHEWADITPDIMAVAKGVGGGFPLGACLTTAEAGKGMTRGAHGTTYGGNPLAMAVGHVVWDEISKPEFLQQVQDTANHFGQALEGLKDVHSDVVVDVRGKGLLRGIKLTLDPMSVRHEAFSRGLLVGTAGDGVLRMAPPLIIDGNDVAEAVSILDQSISAAKATAKAA